MYFRAEIGYVGQARGVFGAGELMEDEEARTPTSELHAAYLAWAESAKVPFDRRYGQDGFAKALAGRFTRCRIGTGASEPA